MINPSNIYHVITTQSASARACGACIAGVDEGRLLLFFGLAWDAGIAAGREAGTGLAWHGHLGIGASSHRRDFTQLHACLPACAVRNAPAYY